MRLCAIWGTLLLCTGEKKALCVQSSPSQNDLKLEDMERVLPLETLANVRDLTVSCQMSPSEPRWPASWSALTGVTRLALHCGLEYHPDFVPGFLSGMSGLRHVELTGSFDWVDGFGAIELPRLMADLPGLTRLEVGEILLLGC